VAIVTPSRFFVDPMCAGPIVTTCISMISVASAGHCTLWIMGRMRRVCGLLLATVIACGCAPALDWRQVRFADIGLEAQFPCRPAGLAREVQLAGKRAPMEMHGCAAEGSTYAVGVIALDDVRDVAAVLYTLKAAAAQNLQTTVTAGEGFAVPGMTPNPQSGRWALKGRRPDGSAVVEHLLVFARGTRVYQASVLGGDPAPEVVLQFLSGIRVA
jgi:hypothetical protein